MKGKVEKIIRTFSEIIYGFVFNDILGRVDKVSDVFVEVFFGRRG